MGQEYFAVFASATSGAPSVALGPFEAITDIPMTIDYQGNKYNQNMSFLVSKPSQVKMFQDYCKKHNLELISSHNIQGN